jgi:hypothetical protein
VVDQEQQRHQDQSLAGVDMSLASVEDQLPMSQRSPTVQTPVIVGISDALTTPVRLWKCSAMELSGVVLGPALTRFNDYVGTVAADDAEATQDQPSLYELANIDRDRYTILAVDLRIDGTLTATAYAIDRIEHGITRHDEIPELSKMHGEIPVVPFDIPQSDVEELIRHAFRRISVRLVTQHLSDHLLIVSEPSSPQ